MISAVSLVIPCHNPSYNLEKLTNNIQLWSQLPQEILLIDSSLEPVAFTQDFTNFCNINDVVLKIFHAKNLYPGKARNLGIKNSEYPIIAFLDILTLPTPDWLKDGCVSVEESESEYQGVWGNTIYIANTRFKKLMRACTFGNLPIRTLPGSIIKKSAFELSGLFIESTRAGEDADWMSRAALHKLSFKDPAETLSYDGLSDMTLFGLVRKWYRNYFFSAQLPYLTAHKDIYFYFAALFFILIAFNWNSLSYDDVLNGWNTQSLTYIPNITKASIAFFSLVYVSARCIILPFNKGASLKYIGLNLPFIIALSMILDLVKSVAFVTARIFGSKS